MPYEEVTSQQFHQALDRQNGLQQHSLFHVPLIWPLAPLTALDSHFEPAKAHFRVYSRLENIILKKFLEPY